MGPAESKLPTFKPQPKHRRSERDGRRITSRTSSGVTSVTSDNLRNYLQRRAVEYEEKLIQAGRCFRCKTGEIFNVFDTGRISYQGKQTALTDEVRALENSAVGPAAQPTAGAAEAARPIFIVYGRDTDARNNLELILRRMGQAPVILDQLPAAGDTVIEKLERYIGEHGSVGYACVLLTPDDEGNKVTEPEKKRNRARQTSCLSLEWFWLSWVGSALRFCTSNLLSFRATSRDCSTFRLASAWRS